MIYAALAGRPRAEVEAGLAGASFSDFKATRRPRGRKAGADRRRDAAAPGRSRLHRRYAARRRRACGGASPSRCWGEAYALSAFCGRQGGPASVSVVGRPAAYFRPGRAPAVHGDAGHGHAEDELIAGAPAAGCGASDRLGRRGRGSCCSTTSAGRSGSTRSTTTRTSTPGDLPEDASRAVAIAADLIEREVDQHRWVANDRSSSPARCWTTCPTTRPGIVNAVGRFATELSDQVARVRGSTRSIPISRAPPGGSNIPATSGSSNGRARRSSRARRASTGAAVEDLRRYNQRLATGPGGIRAPRRQSHGDPGSGLGRFGRRLGGADRGGRRGEHGLPRLQRRRDVLLDQRASSTPTS